MPRNFPLRWMQCARSCVDSPTFPITIAYGDEAGPELMTACLANLRAIGAPLAIESVEIGQRFYENGVIFGIPPYALASMGRTGVLLKAPTTMPNAAQNIDISHWLTAQFSLTIAQQNSLAQGKIGPALAVFEPLHPTHAAMHEAAGLMLEYLGLESHANRLRNSTNTIEIQAS